MNGSGSGSGSGSSGGLLAGRVALVTGSTRGIGKGIARHLVALGAAVGINGIDGQAEAVCAELRAARTPEPGPAGAGDGGRARPAVHPVDGDVADEATVERIFDELERAFGQPVDLLVCNAGIPSTGYHFLDLPAARFDELLRVNLRGVFLPAQRFARALVAAGRPGAIVTIGSVGGARAHWDNVPYDATKGGVEAGTRALALDLARHRIRANCVCPGFTRTERWAELTPEQLAGRRALIPLGQEALPEDIGAAVAFLGSEAARTITGQTLYVDGGLTAQLHPPLYE